MQLFSKFFTSCFMFGHKIKPYSVSEKSTHRFSQNDGTKTQTDDIQIFPFIYVYVRVIDTNLIN